jgi:hypothetical protein
MSSLDSYCAYNIERYHIARCVSLDLLNATTQHLGQLNNKTNRIADAHL